jgi:hypothetical protein
MGRLTWLRSVVLNMNAVSSLESLYSILCPHPVQETSAQEHMLISQQQATMLTPYYVKEYRWHSPIGLNGQRGAPNRDHVRGSIILDCPAFDIVSCVVRNIVKLRRPIFNRSLTKRIATVLCALMHKTDSYALADLARLVHDPVL